MTPEQITALTLADRELCRAQNALEIQVARIIEVRTKMIALCPQLAELTPDWSEE